MKKTEKQINERIFELESAIDQLRAYDSIPNVTIQEEITARRNQIKALQWVLSKE